MTTPKGISEAPVFASDRSSLVPRTWFDFSEYGFQISPALHRDFDVAPAICSPKECFLFFFAHEDVAKGRWALFNLHVFLQRSGSMEDFARSLGESVKQVALSPVVAFKKAGLGYSRTITMAELFKGAESAIGLIGGSPERTVRDSHFYFAHRDAHCYSGVLHLPGEEQRYDALRDVLFNAIEFAD